MLFSIRLGSLFVSTLLLYGCGQPETSALDQQLYVWQRQWTPAHQSALRDSRADFCTLRVLALQSFPQAGWSRARVDANLLRQDGRPLIAVVRLDGQLQSVDRHEVMAQVEQLIIDWQGQGLTLAGVEIDHDAGVARLPEYRLLLTELRKGLPASMSLSITALPAWLSSAELPALLAAVDSSVLQVHAVSNPQNGLFHVEQTKKWTQAWSRVTSKPFYLALPAYGVALLPASSGGPIVESEVTIERDGERRELLADPQQLRDLGLDLRNDPPEHLAGLIWFRLPLAHDRRAWSLTTLRAVARGEVLRSQLELQVSEHEGLFDISIINRGNLDSPWPDRMTLAVTDCEGADALAGYALQQTQDTLTFSRLREGRIAADGQRALGWARCAKIDQGASHVYP